MYDFFSKLVVCGLLIYSTFVSTPEQAIAVFTSKRFEPTLTPSQVRYHGSKMGTFGLFISFIYHTCSFFSNVQKLFLFFFSQNYCSFSIYFVRFLTERPFSKSIKKRWFNIIVCSGKIVSFYQQKISFFRPGM